MPRRPPLSYLLAAAVLLALLLWLLLGDMQRFQATAPAPQAPPPRRCRGWSIASARRSPTRLGW
ncbi:hypothetical protein [Halomonas sp. E19]|uniref:hypothetical protein n=1 Tax=Halomonas sp. E19 TaxID=3397247 RepID=UPI00403460CC